MGFGGGEDVCSFALSLVGNGESPCGLGGGGMAWQAAARMFGGGAAHTVHTYMKLWTGGAALFDRCVRGSRRSFLWWVYRNERALGNDRSSILLVIQTKTAKSWLS